MMSQPLKMRLYRAFLFFLLRAKCFTLDPTIVRPVDNYTSYFFNHTIHLQSVCDDIFRYLLELLCNKMSRSRRRRDKTRLGAGQRILNRRLPSS